MGKRKAAEILELEKKKTEELLVEEKQKTEALLFEEKRKLDDALKQLNAIKEKGKVVITLADEELAELKSDLERKNLEFVEQIVALRLIAENNDKLSIELETMKDDLDDMDKELQALRVAIWKIELKSPLAMSLSKAYER